MLQELWFCSCFQQMSLKVTAGRCNQLNNSRALEFPLTKACASLTASGIKEALQQRTFEISCSSCECLYRVTVEHTKRFTLNCEIYNVKKMEEATGLRYKRWRVSLSSSIWLVKYHVCSLYIEEQPNCALEERERGIDTGTERCSQIPVHLQYSHTNTKHT